MSNSGRQPLSLAGTEMMLSEIKLIAAVAEKACAAAINHPRNADVLADLSNALGALIDATFVENDATYSSRIHELLRQIHIWADIVRCRMDISGNSNTTTSASLIQYPARDLRRLLSQLLVELSESES